MHNNMNTKSLKFAIVGPGAVGKSTVIGYLNSFLDENNFEKIDEREYINVGFGGYMSDMKGKAFNTQIKFFAKRYEQVQRLTKAHRAIMDRHLIDDFIFPRAHMAIGNFSPEESKEWESIEKQYWDDLKKEQKLDLLIVLLAPYELIQERRISRAEKEKFRKEELSDGNDVLFEKVNEMYYDKSSIMYDAAKEFSNQTLVIENFNSEATAQQIIDTLTKALNE